MGISGIDTNCAVVASSRCFQICVFTLHMITSYTLTGRIKERCSIQPFSCDSPVEVNPASTFPHDFLPSRIESRNLSSSTYPLFRWELGTLWQEEPQSGMSFNHTLWSSCWSESSSSLSGNSFPLGWELGTLWRKVSEYQQKVFEY